MIRMCTICAWTEWWLWTVEKLRHSWVQSCCTHNMRSVPAVLSPRLLLYFLTYPINNILHTGIRYTKAIWPLFFPLFHCLGYPNPLIFSLASFLIFQLLLPLSLQVDLVECVEKKKVAGDDISVVGIQIYLLELTENAFGCCGKIG